MRYAAYGSNLHPRRLFERLPGAEFLGTAFVPNWALKFHKRSQDGSGKCNIVPSGGGIYVAIYDITHEEKKRLDDIEGIGNGYVDGIIDVPTFSQCCTYLAHEAHIDDALRPYDWYKEIVLYGCRKHRFPAGYKATIVETLTIEDSDDARRRENEALLARLILEI